MAQKTPTKLVNTKICRCCCKPLGSNDHPISLLGEKSQTEANMDEHNEITGHVVNHGTHTVRREIGTPDCKTYTAF